MNPWHRRLALPLRLLLGGDLLLCSLGCRSRRSHLCGRLLLCGLGVCGGRRCRLLRRRRLRRLALPLRLLLGRLFLRLSSRRLGSCLSLLDGGELLGRVGRLRWSLCTPLLSLLLLLLLPTAPPAALLLLAVPVPLRIAPLLRSVSSSRPASAGRR